MRYWLKRMEWKIRKALGLQKKRVKTMDDIKSINAELFWKVLTILAIVMLIIKVGEGIAKLWMWFFPKILRLPVRSL